MSVMDRVSQFISAYGGLNRLNERVELQRGDPKAVMGSTFEFSKSYIRPIQEKGELLILLEDVIKLNPLTVLEIGTSLGGTLYLWTRFARNDATIVSVDLRGGAFGGGYSRARGYLYRRFARERQKLHLVRANSHDRSTCAQVQRLVEGRQIDFLFLDGDHTYEGIKMDWEIYSPLVRPGGLIAFHDVAGNYESTEVKRLWDSIKGNYEHREYIVRDDGHYGIGVLIQH